MTAPRPQSLPLKHRLYVAASKRDGSPIALVEARDDQQAAARATYVVGQLGLAECQEVELRPAQGCMARVPTFLDAFFLPGLEQRPLH